MRASLDPATMAELRELGRELGEDVLGQVVAAFEATGPPLGCEIGDALAAGDPARLARSAHTLKSASAQIGARRLQEIAAELEQAARAGRSEGLDALATACADELAAVCEALSALERGAR